MDTVIVNGQEYVRRDSVQGGNTTETLPRTQGTIRTVTRRRVETFRFIGSRPELELLRRFLDTNNLLLDNDAEARVGAENVGQTFELTQGAAQAIADAQANGELTQSVRSGFSTVAVGLPPVVAETDENGATRYVMNRRNEG